MVYSLSSRPFVWSSSAAWRAQNATHRCVDVDVYTHGLPLYLMLLTASLFYACEKDTISTTQTKGTFYITHHH
ncbi:hypothetical protein STCU_10298 [Strigomonas culicis]|uniref:Uncharacterized protein n=1 Tax=Strigomonas culicis TaxID=28005 RepID=S9V4Y2_9TRYP|nr:hypothetical protein STCU_10298 [Strigomonas culicis]|eukprot:EPY17950.1 hypothetical protein STCU_10298 [Strigomonas culicis]